VSLISKQDKIRENKNPQFCTDVYSETVGRPVRKDSQPGKFL